tara:strand:+ start:166 stop:414 length:249 start_codon:yes stop_codon:yes gene_type:complete
MGLNKELQEYINEESIGWFCEIAKILRFGRAKLIEEGYEEGDDLEAELHYMLFEYIEDEIYGNAPSNFEWLNNYVKENPWDS